MFYLVWEDSKCATWWLCNLHLRLRLMFFSSFIISHTWGEGKLLRSQCGTLPIMLWGTVKSCCLCWVGQHSAGFTADLDIRCMYVCIHYLLRVCVCVYTDLCVCMCLGVYVLCVFFPFSAAVHVAIGHGSTRKPVAHFVFCGSDGPGLLLRHRSLCVSIFPHGWEAFFPLSLYKIIEMENLLFIFCWKRIPSGSTAFSFYLERNQITDVVSICVWCFLANTF